MPKVIFTYSWMYDDQQRLAWNSAVPKKITPYPSEHEIRLAMRRLERAWRPVEQKIFRALTRISGIPWETNDITCYLVGRTRPFSDPLTMPSYVGKDVSANRRVDVLTHELIHRLIGQPSVSKRTDTRFKQFSKKHAGENHAVRIHILIHAIHERLLLDLFGSKRLAIEIKEAEASPDYRRAWELVTQTGAAKIVQDFFET